MRVLVSIEFTARVIVQSHKSTWVDLSKYKVYNTVHSLKIIHLFISNNEQ